MTYTEEQVKEIVATNVKLMELKAGLHAHISKLEEELSKEKLLRESAEKKYSSLCERCMTLYVTDRDIPTDTMFVQVSAPRFMNNDDFAQGITQHIISACVAEREKTIFHSKNTDWYKPIE